MIRACLGQDLPAMSEIINDAAQAYCGVIPDDRWHQPYMPLEELQSEIAEGVRFWGYEEEGQLLGVMGLQHVQDVALIRHAYVRTAMQSRGIGGRLLAHLRTLTERPLLVGTWANALWAVRFYEKHGFHIVSYAEKERLLRTYWRIPERQVATSVVLADEHWAEAQAGGVQVGVI
jgi:N-acetylglutamate synthase-like GNAT family acetyltransferase